MDKLKVDLRGVDAFIQKELLADDLEKAQQANLELSNKTGAGNNMLGWINLPKNKLVDEEFKRILESSNIIKSKCDIFIVIGIGGSYLGARAVIEALKPDFSSRIKDNPEVIFLGNNLSSKYISSLLKKIEGKEICVNVISKSGTTTEPAIAFRIIKDFVEKKYGREEAQKRIFVTTDAQKGALKEIAKTEKYENFIVPENIGGRYSVLSAVGLLPIAVAGVDIKELLEGAEAQMEDDKADDAIVYAAVRNSLYNIGKEVELLVNYEPSMAYFSEWWKQLFGESEGKDGKGIFPASVLFTTDLHSMGQYIQDGKRMLFETVIQIEESDDEVTIPDTGDNIDELQYLASKKLSYINQKALEATFLAHIEGGVPNILISLPKLNAYNLGRLIYFFEKSCAISGYILGVNPFDQPSVEAYKKKMFSLLGKPSLG